MTVPGLEDDQLYVWKDGDLYCQTPAALQAALDRLRTHGYTCNPSWLHNSDQAFPRRYYWLASNRTITKIKCGFCHGLSNDFDKRSTRDHCCELCGKVIWHWVTTGSIATFRLLGERHRRGLKRRVRRAFDSRLNMKVISWNQRTGRLHLDPELITPSPLGPASSLELSGQKALDHIQSVPGALRLVTNKGGQQVYRTSYRRFSFPDPTPRRNRIDILKSQGHGPHGRMVQIWDGVELTEDSGRHAPKNFGVFAGWRNEWTAGYAHRLMWIG